MSERVLLTADPKAGFLAHAEEIRAAIERVLESGHYILGPEGEMFEREFTAYQGGGFTLGVANGTEAIELALRALGVKAGDRVATVGNTVTATISAIQQIGAVPVFVEIDPSTMTMSAHALKAVLARVGNVKVVMPVHLYGHMSDMPAILDLAESHGAKVVEDCAQAHGAMLAGRKAGSWGDAAAFSFYPTKNLGALGDGGAVYTRDADVAERIRLLRQYGWRTRYVSEIPGRNSRLDEIQAAVLRVKLNYLEKENAQRKKLAARYLENLEGTPLSLPVIIGAAQPAWHQFVVRTPKRDALRIQLAEQGIHCGVLYPVPVYRQPAYVQAAADLPETDRACSEVLCLPVHPGITLDDVDRVCAEIRRCLTS